MSHFDRVFIGLPSGSLEGQRGQALCLICALVSPFSSREILDTDIPAASVVAMPTVVSLVHRFMLNYKETVLRVTLIIPVSKVCAGVAPTSL